MDDRKIVELYWERSESAIRETQKKYGKYCNRIAMNILNSFPDAEECVNDAYLQVWNSIPPKKPLSLAAYIGKIVRNLSINRIVHQSAEKRSARVTTVLEEAEEFLPSPAGETSLSDELALKEAINGFLATLSAEHRAIFLYRYWYLSSVKEIAKRFKLSESNVKVILHRTRGKFKEYLEKEGIQI